MATKIIYVITKANWGGAQRYVYDMAVAARDAGYEVVVVYGDEGELARRLSEAGVRTIRIESLTRDTGLLHEIHSFFGLLRILRKERPTVVHVNSSKAGGLGCLAARVARVPRIIFTAHGWAFNEARPLWQKFVIYKLVWFTVLLSHRTICVSEAVLRDVIWMPFVRRKCVLIRNGIECTSLFSREEARAALAPHAVGQYWVGMAGELIPTKRVEDALRALAFIVPKHPEAILVVLGEGRERETLEKLIRELHLRDHVSLAGFRGDASFLLKAFDLFIHASSSEALGYAILEAGCASLPVVATNVGGIPEIIPDDDHGLLVPPCDPQSLALAIESLMLDRPRAAELGARLRARVQNSFSKKRMAAETFALYKR
ncbi:MAG TPA: glycosyltransferase family 4 protein [Candidatus Paceibacterota bacterium]